ncbi:YbaY family lipoprotein [Leptolyngbya sp. AN02str]|uniref:YbaY family lipoprotein n=1 Tax=Leptolyngbya sp. AN02str TaxID=3423363 RepID=UPI003D3172D6
MKKLAFSRMFAAGLSLTVLGQGIAAAVPSPLPQLAQTSSPWYNCLTREVFTPEKQAWCDRLNTLFNATYPMPTLGPDPQVGTATFENGQFSDPNRELTITLFREQGRIAMGDIDDDASMDAIVTMVMNTGGTGNFVYLAPVLNVDGDRVPLMPIGLGDRVRIVDIEILGNNRFSVDMVTQGPNDPACCPSLEVVQYYELRDREIVQIPQPDDVAPNPAVSMLPNGTTIAFFQTGGYAVRVFVRDGITRMNLFNKQTGRLELNGVSAVVSMDPEGVTYSYDGPNWTHVYLNNTSGQSLSMNGEVQQDVASVSGTITYRPRIALPPNAIVEVSLADVSRADAPARVLASQTLVTQGRQVPFAFELNYDPSQISNRDRYVVQSRITVDGELQFINTSAINVITNGNPTQNVEVVVDPV